MRSWSFRPQVGAAPAPDDAWVPLLVRPAVARADLDAALARLADGHPLTAAARADLARLVNDANRQVDDGYAGTASACDSAAFLTRQLAHARRRLR
jgi:hypothetical protein